MCALPALAGGQTPHISAVEARRTAGTHFLALLRPDLLRVHASHLVHGRQRDNMKGKDRKIPYITSSVLNPQKHTKRRL